MRAWPDPKNQPRVSAQGDQEEDRAAVQQQAQGGGGVSMRLRDHHFVRNRESYESRDHHQQHVPRAATGVNGIARLFQMLQGEALRTKEA